MLDATNYYICLIHINLKKVEAKTMEILAMEKQWKY